MKTILIATIGTTPAVLTETVWALAVNGKSCLGEEIIPDVVIAFAYEKCKEDFCLKVLSPRGDKGYSGWDSLTKELKNRKYKVEGKLKFGPANIVYYSDNGHFIEDANNQNSCEAIANTFVSKINSLRNDTSEEVRIIASISGGRKSDSALLLSCMGLLGREGDRIIHLIPYVKGLTKEYLINRATPPFLFPKMNGVYKSDDGKILFSAKDVELKPFEIPLLMTDRRHEINLISGCIHSYSDIIKEQQAVLKEEHRHSVELKFDFERGDILVDNCHIDPSSKRGRINHSVFLAILCEAFLDSKQHPSKFCHEFILAANLFYENEKGKLPLWLIEMARKPDKGPFKGKSSSALAIGYNKQLSLARELFNNNPATRKFIKGTNMQNDWHKEFINYQETSKRFTELVNRILPSATLKQ